ncbi:haloacid dehalogenase type II [Fusarium napiforme]|uniref:Haloacid dehalogenase type II n=1 Tax=Fusarium napiforme TaxID=42672 RepID=A0A8H5J2Q1_9HYPO|nr:haloacid dehalogenase type II [Fusarium napiforme]
MPSLTVLVLGGTGPAGINLLRELLHRKHKVVVYARNPQKVPEYLASNPSLEIVKGELSDKAALDRAVAKVNIVISLLGPLITDRTTPPNSIPDFYKNSLFPAMRRHGVKRIFAMGTLTITQKEDSWTMLQPTINLMVRTVFSNAYRSITSIGKVFEVDAKDLDWTIFRISAIPGGSDQESWAKDREDGKPFVGYVGQKGYTYSFPRGALARWLVDAAESGLQDWVRKAPAVSKLSETFTNTSLTLPIISRLPSESDYKKNPVLLIQRFHELTQVLEEGEPTLRYGSIVSRSFKSLADELSISVPEEEMNHLESLPGTWLPFPDTIPGLQILKKHYKLIILTNVDNVNASSTLKHFQPAEFDKVYTAEDIGSYKPAKANFDYLFDHLRSDLSVDKDRGELLHVARSLTADHVPAKWFGLRSVWISRGGEKKEGTGVGGDYERLKENVEFEWRFDSIGKFAEEIERQFAEKTS